VSWVNVASIAVGIATVLGGITAMIQFLIKHYLSELKPNGGGSVKDQLTRLETRVDRIFEMLSER
jgi:hypothetical protein